MGFAGLVSRLVEGFTDVSFEKFGFSKWNSSGRILPLGWVMTQKTGIKLLLERGEDFQGCLMFCISLGVA